MHILCTYSAQIGQGFAPSFVHYSSRSKQATQKEHKQSKRRRRASKQENFVWMSRRKPRSYLPCWPHLPVLLQQTLFFCFLCCCLSAAFLLLSDLRLHLSCFWSSPLSTRRSRWRSRRSSRRQDEDQDGDEHKDQGEDAAYSPCHHHRSHAGDPRPAFASRSFPLRRHGGDSRRRADHRFISGSRGGEGWGK